MFFYSDKKWYYLKTLPFLTATSRAVSPLTFFAFKFAPRSMSDLTTFSSPENELTESYLLFS